MEFPTLPFSNIQDENLSKVWGQKLGNSKWFVCRNNNHIRLDRLPPSHTPTNKMTQPQRLGGRGEGEGEYDIFSPTTLLPAPRKPVWESSIVVGPSHRRKVSSFFYETKVYFILFKNRQKYSSQKTDYRYPTILKFMRSSSSPLPYKFGT